MMEIIYYQFIIMTNNITSSTHDKQNKQINKYNKTTRMNRSQTLIKTNKTCNNSCTYKLNNKKQSISKKQTTARDARLYMLIGKLGAQKIQIWSQRT